MTMRILPAPTPCRNSAVERRENPCLARAGESIGPLDTTKGAMDAVLESARQFEVAILSTDNVDRLLWLRERLSLLVQTLQDAENLALAKAEHVQGGAA